MSEHPPIGSFSAFARPLYDIANIFESAASAEARIRRVLDLLQQVVPYDRCALLEAQPGLERRFILVPEPEPADERTALLDVLGRLFMLLSEHHPKLEELEESAPLKVWDAHLAVPLVGLDQVIGLLFVGRNGEPYKERDLCFLSVVAAQTAAYLTTIRLRQEEERARLAAEDANRAKDEFMAIISHELRTPLTAMMGWAHLLGTGSLSEASRARAIETIRRNAAAQGRIIEDLLDMSRITTGKLRLELRPVELGALVDVAVEAARLHAEGKSIRLECASDPAVGQVMGDPDRLQQILSNLLTNAIKFTPSGGEVALRVERGTSHVRIQVKDTGRGISAEVLPSIFARFRQVDRSSRRGQDGLGLGLAIVRSLVELHGGQVRAESPGVGQGSTFTVDLPRPGGAALSSRAPEGMDRDAPAAAYSLEGLRVLVVDDDTDTGDILRTMLEHYGAEVMLAASEAEAQAAVERSRLDVLLSDLSMLADGGHDFTRKVTALAAQRGARLPMAALTADATSQDRDQALSAGFQMYLTKPIAPTRLAAAVAHLAGSRWGMTLP